MKLKPYDSDDGMKVWLTKEELDRFLDQPDDTERQIALGLMGRCGLRSDEVVDITPADVVDTPAGPRVRVWQGKGDKSRETPIPDQLLSMIETYADVREASPDKPLVDRSTRTIQRWVDDAAAPLRVESTDEEGWRFIGPHDLRRTWGTLLVDDEVLPHVIMDWGGWEDWETFREHYLGAASPAVERRELSKVDWLSAG